MNDELQARPIPGIDPTRYLARADGRIVSVRRGCPMRSCPGNGGHPTLTLRVDGRSQAFKVASLICAAFNGRPRRGQWVRFKSGNEQDTSASNLYWGRPWTKSHWQGNYGEDCKSHRLTEQQAAEALERASRGESSTTIAASYGVTPRTIRWLVAGHTWPHLPRPDGLRHRRVRRMLPRLIAKAA